MDGLEEDATPVPESMVHEVILLLASAIPGPSQDKQTICAFVFRQDAHHRLTRVFSHPQCSTEI